MGCGRTVMQPREHEHAGGGTAYQTHPAHSAAKRGRETKGELFVRNTVQVSAGSKNRLCAVKALLEEFCRPLGTSFYLLLRHDFEYF